MQRYADAVELIKAHVSMRDAIALYLPHLAPQGDRIPCPIHRGANPNFWFSDRGYNCFTCGATGDVITFAQAIFAEPFRAALVRLNTDFNCGAILDRPLTLREQRAAQERQRARLAEADRVKAEKREVLGRYDALMDEWHRLDVNKRRYAPKSPDDEMHPLFVEAVKWIDYRAYLADVFEAEQTM